jgi:hypothetical protein
MIATASDAVEALRHKRTGEVLATKKIARNTRLVYYADELVGLKLHETIIAMYKPDGVTIDLRGPLSPNPEGWFTNVTLDRIENFTPARLSRAGGLTYVWNCTAADGGIAPYAHGTHVNPDGSCEIPIEAPILSAIERVVSSFPARLRRHADRIVATWADDWAATGDCCQRTEDQELHALDHFERGEAVVPSFFADFMAVERDTNGLYGEKLLEKGREYLRSELKGLTTLAVKRLAPDFPYPQLSRTTNAGRNW